MERLVKLVDALNSYEQSVISDNEDFHLYKEETLSYLSKSKKYKEVYMLSKENNLNLNSYVLPYKVFKNEKDKKVYVLKTIEEFKEGYIEALNLIEKYYNINRITRDDYYFLKNNFIEMRKSFLEEFRVTKLDKLSLEDKVEYELSLIDINKKHKEYIERIGEKEYQSKCLEFKKAQIYQKNLLLHKQNSSLRELFDCDKVDVLFVNSTSNNKENDVSNNVYRMDNTDISYYSFDILTLEQIYKLKCSKLKRNNKNINIIGALLEDLEFRKSNFSKINKNSKKRR